MGRKTNKAKEIFKNLILIVPKEQKKTFRKETLKSNYRNILMASIALFLMEIQLYFMPERLFGYKPVILFFICANFLFIPSIWYIKKNIKSINDTAAALVLYLYLYLVLFLGIFLVLESQNKADFVHMYIMAAIGISAFIYLTMLECAAVIGSSFVIFSILLPNYQNNPDVRFVILINCMFFLVLSFLLANIRLKSKYASFIDKQQLIKNAESDLMTDCYNHKTVIEKIAKKIEQAKFSGRKFSVVMIDIDNFKHINDEHGHVAGDEVLKSISDIIKQNTGKKDIIGRYGGDEFLIMIDGANAEDAKEITQKIFDSVKGLEKSVTLSAGLRQFEGQGINQLIKQADKNLYIAKQSGKNRIIY